MPETTNQIKLIRQNKYYRLWLDPKNFNPNDPLSFPHGFALKLEVDFDEKTIKRNSQNIYEVAPQAFTIEENAVKFKTGQTLSFLEFWEQCINKINGILSELSKNAANITSETLRAENAEAAIRRSIESIRTASVAKDTVPTVIYSAELDIRPEVINVRTVSRDTTTGKDTVRITPLPVANSEQVGMMNPETFRAIQDHTKRLMSLENKATTYQVALTEEATETDYQRAYESAAKVGIGTVAPVGTTLLNKNNNHAITYYENADERGNHWIDRGIDTVSIATNDSCGLVKGDDKNTRGKVFIEADGSMSVIGFDEHAAEIKAAAENTAENERKSAASASSAITSAQQAQDEATSAKTSATNAASSASQATTSEQNAEQYSLNAKTYEENAKEWATKTSGPVIDNEYSAKYHAQEAGDSASSAAESETNAFNSAADAANSAGNALSSANASAKSAEEAQISAETTKQNESLLQGYVNQAKTEATKASTSATNASASATTAAGSASAAASSAQSSATSATNAAKSETNASASATSASQSASNASASAASAATSAETAQQIKTDIENTVQTLVTKDEMSKIYKKLTGPQDYGLITDTVSDGETLDYGTL